MQSRCDLLESYPSILCGLKWIFIFIFWNATSHESKSDSSINAALMSPVIVKQVLAIQRQVYLFGWYNHFGHSRGDSFIREITAELHEITFYIGYIVLRDFKSIVDMEDMYSIVLSDTWRDIVNLDEPCTFLSLVDDLKGNEDYCLAFFRLFPDPCKKYGFLIHCALFLSPSFSDNLFDEGWQSSFWRLVVLQLYRYLSDS